MSDLMFGFKCAFNPFKLNYSSHFLAFEKLFYALKTEKIFNATVDSLNAIQSAIKDIAFSSFYSFVSK
jgi:hypothetical protein